MPQRCDEVDVVAAKLMIDETIKRPDLSQKEKEAVLAENARRSFRI
jgi:hypothetical protein